MHTPDFTDENIARLAGLFPNCVTESLDENGQLKHLIDFDRLKQELSGNIVEGSQERYHLDWAGKREALLTANAPIAKTLRPVREESVDYDTTRNLYIECDNLDALKLLQETYLGKVKMIYIDPPYNTGNDFIYEDDFAEDKDAYFRKSMQKDEEGNRLVANNESNGRFHSDWLSMLYPRLKLARNLLRDDRVIFISIDDNEQANLKRMCDEVFGEDNLVASIPWQSRQSIQNDTDISVSHEYIIAYAKVRRLSNRRLKESNKDKWYKDDSFAIYPLPLDKGNFSNPDNDSRGLWKANPFDAPGVRRNLTYEIENPKTGEKHLPPQGRHWGTEEHTFKKLFEDKRILFGTSGTSRPQVKMFYEEKKEFGTIENTWFDGQRTGTATKGTKELQSLFDGIAPFDTSKPTTLIKQLLKLATREDDIILDFFSGSATTAHAVMQINAEDGGNRQFIMVQLPEETDEKSESFKAGYKTIAEIGKERIRRAGKKIKEESEKKNAENKQPLFDKESEIPNPKSQIRIDIGFRVLKIDSSNMKDVYYSPDTAMQGNLLDQIGNIKEDRTAEDLLFQVLVDWGIDLTLSIHTETIAGKTVYFVDENAIAACFDSGITEDFIKELANRQPLRAVFRDSGFESDNVKINAEQIFKSISPSTEVKAI